MPANNATRRRPAPTTVDIAVLDEAWRSDIADVFGLCETAVRAALAAGDDDGDCDVSIALADDALLAQLNASYRGKSGPTNVLSFPADVSEDGRRQLGDVVVARETLLREAAAAGIPTAHHLSHLVVHGVLHLLGFDHERDDDADIMEAREVVALAALDIPNPYQEPPAPPTPAGNDERNERQRTSA